MSSVLFPFLLVGCGSPCDDAYRDLDQDGYGDPASAERQCEVAAGWVRRAGDCDDQNAAVHPDLDDPCNGVDDDCDGTPDPDVEYWYVDSDLDGYGDASGPIRLCPGVVTESAVGWVSAGGDCDDTNANVNPDGTESCNGQDDDCDGLLDLSDGPMDYTVLLWADADGDGAGDPLTRAMACAPSAGWVSTFDDCDDTDPGVQACAPPSAPVQRTLDLAAGRLTGTVLVRVQIAPDLDGDGLGDLAVSFDGDVDGAVTLAVHSGGPVGVEDWLAGADLFSGPQDTAAVRALPEGRVGVVLGTEWAIYTTPLAPGELDPGAADWTLPYDSWGDLAAAGDPNGDGVPDLWYLTKDGLQLVAATPEATVLATLDVSYPQLATGDLTGDGLFEAVTAHTSIDDGGFILGGEVSIIAAPFVDGVATALADTTFFGDDRASHLGWSLDLGGDLDGDGVLDLLMGSSAQYAASVSRPAPGSWSIVPAATTLFVVDGRFVRNVRTGDVDGDGATDAVLGGSADDVDGLLRPQVFVAYGPFSPGTVDAAELDRWGGPSGGEDPLVAVGDLTGDGVAEIAVGIGSTNIVYVVGAP